MASTLKEEREAKQPQRQKTNVYPWYTPRFWHGMRVRDFWALLAKNRFRVHFFRYGMVVCIAGLSAFNSTMCRLQRWRYGRRIQQTEIDQPPIFIVGHWRSGTTHLHELLVRDPLLGFPTTYECFAPSHFLVTEWILPKMFGFILPSKRPMDDMSAGFDRPQEDEFALCSMGAPTPYYRMAFPNEPAPFPEFLNMEGVNPDDLRHFQDALGWFVKALTLKKQKRLVLKSPPHTGRIQLLSQMFPGARFIHIVRNPYEVFASTVRLWKTLDFNQAFQRPRYKDDDMHEYILDAFSAMYQGFRKQAAEIDSSQLFELKYEDLVRDPVSTLQQIYQTFDLEGFDAVRGPLESYLESQKSYRRSHYDLNDDLKAKIQTRWAWYFERYGYTEDS